MEEPSAELMDLVFAAPDHGIDSIKGGGGPLMPFAVTETAEGRKLVRGQEHGRPVSTVLAQRYRPGGRLKLSQTIRPAALATDEPLF
jgi:hypothetical protein